MSKPLQKLELTWIGKGNEPKLEPRILIEDPSKSFGDPKSENMLIHGDNLLALKALEQDFTNKIKCIYIDPPYNTGNAFEHYDDGVEHSQWLSLIKPRLELLKNLLSNDGVIFISISEDEVHYLKVLCDEVFGRNNACGTFIWEKKRKPSFLNSQMGSITEYILCFAKNKSKAPAFSIEKVSDSETYPLYNAGNSRGELKFPPNSMMFLKHDDGIYEPREFREATSLVVLKNKLEVKNGRNANEVILEGEWRYGQNAILEQFSNGDYFVVKTLKFRPRRVFENKDEIKKMHNLLSRSHYEMATYEDATSESKALFGNNPFDYPKPEKLIWTFIECATNPGDIILDSFLGSGTTAAVAHKMNRHYIGIELGEHAVTHCLPRLQQVVSGKDKGGISEAVNWKGGGGFKFYTLAPSLVQQDKYGTEIINPQYNANMLAAAMAKQEGFRYQPDENNYWKQGMSSEKDFIFTTTQFVTVAMLDKLTEELKPGESLLVCCKSFAKSCANRHTNITIKKIPQMLLGRCEFGKDDYSFNIVNLPHNDDTDIEIEDSEESEAPKTEKKTKVKKQKEDDTQSSLF
jgi:adenine-specific DNA-methyltransferase